jgi:hypothetical protein
MLRQRVPGYNNSYRYYCTICIKHDKHLYTSVVTNATFKCPEGKCNSSLSFRQFLDDPCCPTVRTEFQDLTKMMKLLEISEKKDKKAKQEMDLKEKRFQDATLLFSERKEKLDKSRKDLAAGFAYAENVLENFDGNSARTIHSLNFFFI